MIIAIGSDHGGYGLKEKIKNHLSNHEIKDVGTSGSEACDYPDFAKKVAAIVASKKAERGILICRNGIGMCIAANRFKGIRAAVCYDESTAVSSRKHDNTNVLCLGADYTDRDKSIKIIDAWLNAGFDSQERRLRRIKKIEMDDEV